MSSNHDSAGRGTILLLQLKNNTSLCRQELRSNPKSASVTYICCLSCCYYYSSCLGFSVSDFLFLLTTFLPFSIVVRRQGRSLLPSPPRAPRGVLAGAPPAFLQRAIARTQNNSTKLLTEDGELTLMSLGLNPYLRA